MRQYLPLFLLMGLLTIVSVSSTDYSYAQADYVGDTGYLDAGEGDDFIPVYYTGNCYEPVKFLVKRFTRCHEIDFYSDGFWAASKIVIDEGSHKGKTGWVDYFIFYED